jgi:hypothetical protein
MSALLNVMSVYDRGNNTTLSTLTLFVLHIYVIYGAHK